MTSAAPFQVRGPSPAQLVVCAAFIAAVGAWSFWPLGGIVDPSANPAVLPNPAAKPTTSSPPELRIAAFSAPLWVAPPAPPPAPAPKPEPPPPPPLRLQLLAVVNQDGAYEAVLFDPDADKLYTVREGGTLGSRTVERVDATGVDLKDDAGTRTLALKSDGVQARDQVKGAKR